jgi:outer membrane protein
MNIFRTHALVTTLLAVATALVTPSASAGDVERPWQLRLAFVTMDSDANLAEVSDSNGGIMINTGIGGGVSVDMEYRASRRLGLDFGVLAATPSIGTQVEIGWSGVSVSSGITVAPITIGLNVHVTPDSRLDVYLGPLVAYVAYNSFDLNIGPGINESFSTGNDISFGINLGVDVFLGKGRWSVNATFKYIDSTLEAAPSDGDPGTIDFDPMIFGFGVGFRF